MLLPLLVFAQIAVARTPSRPMLSFPEKGLDDVVAYQAYTTRFYRDARGNTVQVYIDGGTGRVVTLLADADNESVGFTARGSNNVAVPLQWSTAPAYVSASGRRRTIEYALTATTTRLNL